MCMQTFCPAQAALQEYMCAIGIHAAETETSIPSFCIGSILREEKGEDG